MIQCRKILRLRLRLDGGKTYTLEVVAIDSFGNESVQPLTAEITTKKDDIDPNVKVPKADVLM